MTEYLLLSFAMLILGNSRSRKISFWLLVSYYGAIALVEFFRYADFHLQIIIRTIGVSLLFTALSIPCLIYSSNKQERIAIYIVTVVSLFVGIFSYVYLPYVTEFILGNCHKIQTEIVSNLCLVMFWENRKGVSYVHSLKIYNYWRLFAFIYVYFLIKVIYYL
jgi:hypothetical protein